MIVRGVGLDAQTRCRHWHSERDIVAIRFACCGEFYACWDCHAELADHPAARWPSDRFDEPAIFCGACQTTLSIRTYLACGATCPECGAAFNPGCQNHWPLYFEMGATC